ncbi:unnamed protein product [Trichogramma brassicae]|uniref:Uncharacterized protein n=1 Tax=Trichogramma brassicae TaxID=86971 RepID=A0A6H5HXE2_9HYME|nr:unnamed protein product [Trichogramma brassicae]
MAANDFWGDDHYDNFVNDLKCLRQKVKWNVEKKRLKFLDQLYESIQNWPDRRRVHLRNIFRKEDIGCLLWDCIKLSGQRFVYFSARSGFSDSEVNALLARTKPPPDATRCEDKGIRRAIVKSTTRIISAPFNLRNRSNHGANHSANHNATTTGLTDFHMASGSSRRQDDIAENTRGRSALQWAVLNLLPDRMDILTMCGADLTSFVFPTESEFIESLQSYNSLEAASKLILASGLLVVVERLERRGYAMRRDDALTIMKLFERYELFERKKRATPLQALGLSSCWHSDVTFVKKAKEMKIGGDLSLNDLIRLRPEQADERGVAYSDYFQFAKSKKLLQLPRDSQRGCAVRLCETMARGFFRRWALNAYLERTDNWLSIDYCKTYISGFRNESLYHYARHKSFFDEPIFSHYLYRFATARQARHQPVQRQLQHRQRRRRQDPRRDQQRHHRPAELQQDSLRSNDQPRLRRVDGPAQSAQHPERQAERGEAGGSRGRPVRHCPVPDLRDAPVPAGQGLPDEGAEGDARASPGRRGAVPHRRGQEPLGGLCARQARGHLPAALVLQRQRAVPAGRPGGARQAGAPPPDQHPLRRRLRRVGERRPVQGAQGLRGAQRPARLPHASQLLQVGRQQQSAGHHRQERRRLGAAGDLLGAQSGGPQSDAGRGQAQLRDQHPRGQDELRRRLLPARVPALLRVGQAQDGRWLGQQERPLHETLTLSRVTSADSAHCQRLELPVHDADRAPTARNSTGQFPNLRDIFRKDEIELLLSDCLKYEDDGRSDRFTEFIAFVACRGYNDKPKVHKNNKPRRGRNKRVRELISDNNIAPKIFEYVKCTDGFEPLFHTACIAGLVDVVEKFLELGQDPNCLSPETGDTPLHLALVGGHKEVVELLLRNGADPNLGNAKGATPLQAMCKKLVASSDLAKISFKVNGEIDRMVRVGVRDELDDEPLHKSVLSELFDIKKFIELLLRGGVDPNLGDKKGLTPLHIICNRRHDDDLARLFFHINDKFKHVVQVDVKDK